MEGKKRVFMVARVWDWQTRLLHWVNALLIISLLVLGLAMESLEETGLEDLLKGLHVTIGYIFVATFSLRVLWGFMGNEYARWSDLLPGGKRLKEIWGNIRWYLSGFKGRPPLSIGHNPLASLFYIPLFVVLFFQATTGLVLSGGKDLLSARGSYFPSVAYADEDEEWGERGWYGEGEEGEGSEWAEEVHEFGFYFILFFLLAHLTGLVVHEIGEEAGLFSSMIHGKKHIPID